MAYMNKGTYVTFVANIVIRDIIQKLEGLDVQFKNKNLTCVLDYISQSEQQKENIIRNYLASDMFTSS